jgi:structural maintenance of chromosome 2
MLNICCLCCFRFPQLQFDYTNPEKNFDRSKVHGLVCKLIKVKDVKMATALEVSAGGKVSNTALVIQL